MNHLQFQVAVGTIAVTWNSQGLLNRIDWYDNGRQQLLSSLQGPYAPGSWNMLSKVEIAPPLANLLNRLRGYFEEGEPIGQIPWDAIDQRGWTEFQLRVYQALTEIPHGETRTYAWVAKRVGKAAAPRAVGQALRKNPFPVLIPCHRVVSSTALGGFMGTMDPDQPELKFKKWLIDLEGSYINPMFPFLNTMPSAEPNLELAGVLG